MNRSAPVWPPKVNKKKRSISCNRTQEGSIIRGFLKIVLAYEVKVLLLAMKHEEMMKHVLLLTVAAFLSMSVEAKWAQSQFLISFWVDPIVDPSSFVAEYKRIAEASFTTVLGGFGATSPAVVKAQVAACQATGLECLPTTCEGLNGPWGTNSSCVGIAAGAAGYQVIDEPAQSSFPQLALWAKSLQSRAPAALRFMNLLPNYGFGVPSSVAYTSYVDAFVAEVKPDMLCFDHYPLFYPGSATDQTSDVSMAGYHRNLQIIRRAALSANIPFFNFFAAMPFNGRPDMSEAQLRWQAFTSLTYGAKGLLYFCYWTPSGTSFVWSNAIMTPKLYPGNATASYAKGPHYAQAAAINAALRVLGGFLFNHTSLAVTLCSGTGDAVVDLPPSSACFANVSGTGAGSSWSVLVGGFSGQIVVLHNQNPEYPLLVSAGLRGAWSALKEVDRLTGLRKPVANDAPLLPGLALYLDAAEVRVFTC